MYTERRSRALTWWRELEHWMKEDILTSWKKTLPDTNYKKELSNSVLALSSSAIEELFVFAAGDKPVAKVDDICDKTSCSMKRYLAFKGLHNYPDGGMGDFKGDFDTLEEATAHVTDEDNWRVWSHVWDSETRKIVWLE